MEAFDFSPPSRLLWNPPGPINWSTVWQVFALFRLVFTLH